MPRRPMSSPGIGLAMAAFLGFSLVAIMAIEWRRQGALDHRLGQRERLLEYRQELLHLERELLLARSDEAEIVSAGRDSLRPRLDERHRAVESGLARVASELEGLAGFETVQIESLAEAASKYRQSVEAELLVIDRLGRASHSGLLATLRDLEERLLSMAPTEEIRQRLLVMQVAEREFADTLQTSKAFSLMADADALHRELQASGVGTSEFLETLQQYREHVQEAMEASLEVELQRGESGVRFERLPGIFLEVLGPLDRQLELDAERIAELRRNAALQVAAFLALALALVTWRIRYELGRSRRMEDRIRRLAAGMHAFAEGADPSTLDLPASGRYFGRVNASFHAMAEQIRSHMAMIEEERRRAEWADQAKSDFLARVSHELRTPLNGILGMSDLLQDSVKESRQQHLVDVIHRSGITLLSVVNDLLDFSQLEAGKLALETRRFDLLDMLEDLMEIHTPTAHGKGLELVLRAPGDLGAVDADPLRLGQILTNLLGNAIKFTESGHVDLEVVALEALDAGTGRLEIAVRDTGPGVPEHLRDHIFDAFAQGEAVLRRKHGGSGLGLSIVQELLRLMHGTIELKAEPGYGACFHMSAEVGWRGPVAWTPGPLEGRRLAVVDPHGPSLRALAGTLESMGAVVESRQGDTSTLVEWLGEEAFDADGVLLGHAVTETPGPGEEPCLAPECFPGRREVVHVLSASQQHGGDVAEGLSVARPPRRQGLLGALVPRDPGPPSPTSVDSMAWAPLAARILLVEDNEVNQELIQLMLETQGCETVVANHGGEALGQMERGGFDLVLMDCYMPEMDGYEATRRIRALPDARSRIPIIGLTASAFEKNLERCREAGMDEVLTKPTTVETLRTCLERWIQAPSAGLPDPERAAHVPPNTTRRRSSAPSQ